MRKVAAMRAIDGNIQSSAFGRTIGAWDRLHDHWWLFSLWEFASAGLLRRSLLMGVIGGQETDGRSEDRPMRVGVSRAIRVACLGALAFWGPDILVHAIRRHLFDRPEVLVLTITMPLTLLLCWVIVGKYLGISAKSAAVRMLLGIWLLGGLCMTIGASFSGGGFAGPDGVRGAAIVLGMSLVPIYTFIMATYDGSLGALLLVTAILLTVWLFPFSRLKATRLKQLYR